MLTAEARVRRLRRRLTALFALTSTVGLLGLAAFAIHSDSSSRRHQIDAELRQEGSTAVRVLGYDDQGRLLVEDLAYTVDTDCPQLTVTARTSGGFTVVQSPRTPCVRARDADVRALAAQAVAADAPVQADREAADGRPLRLLAEPFDGPDGDTPGGAVVLAADGSVDQAQGRLRVVLLVGSLVLALLSALVGHLWSGRAIRPALTALRQQEQFLADAAHDLRTPTATLRALAATALREQARQTGRQPSATDTLRTTALQRTEHLAARMGDLVDGLLTRARLMAGVGTVVREQLRLDQLVEVVVDDTDTGEHRVDVATAPVVVSGDPDLLRRAVANLLGNALQHGHAPGRPADIRISVTADGAVFVDDSGPGVPAELAGSLFERFRSGSGSGSSGLGLSIASWVAHAHGGTLTVATSPSGGARFILQLAPSG